MNETDADSWIQDNGKDFSVQFPGDQNLTWQFIIYDAEGPSHLKRATWVDPHGGGEPSTFQFRFAEVNGRKALIADMAFYYQVCKQPEIKYVSPDSNLPKVGQDY